MKFINWNLSMKFIKFHLVLYAHINNLITILRIFEIVWSIICGISNNYFSFFFLIPVSRCFSISYVEKLKNFETTKNCDWIFWKVFSFTSNTNWISSNSLNFEIYYFYIYSGKKNLKGFLLSHTRPLKKLLQFWDCLLSYLWYL